MLEGSAIELVNTIRAKYSPPGVGLPPFNGTRLFLGINSRHWNYCKRLMSNFASQGSSFPIELNCFGRQVQTSRHRIIVEMSSPQMMAIRASLSKELGFVLRELARYPPARTGLPAHALSWHEKPFYPATSLCTLSPGEKEVSIRILDELNSEFPIGLGSAYATGLSLLLVPPRLRDLKAMDPTIGPYFVDFPFTGSR